mgnify:CR=1 FL=1
MAKTVYLGMIGDIMHPGYINIINKATEYGDVIIGLFTDKAIANHRRLPYLTWEQRKNVVESIRNVSRVALRMIGAMSLISLSTSLITSFMVMIGRLVLTSISVMRYSK